MAEFERLREELRRTEMVRDKQVEMLHALAAYASHGMDVPQVWNFLTLHAPYTRVLGV